MTRLGNSFALALVALLLFTATVFAETLKITSEDGEVLATFDQASLEALGLQEMQTETPWTDGVVTFEGVAIKKVLSTVGVTERNVTGFATDDYAASISAEIIESFDPIIATRMNGVPMAVGNKGPFWIMFDFDDLSNDTAIEIRSFAVWHLNEIEVE